MVCHSLLQWTTFCQNSPAWPIRLWWPYLAWLSFIELDKNVVHVIRLVSFLWLWFQSVCPLIPSLSTLCLTGVSLTLDVGCLFSGTHCSSAAQLPLIAALIYSICFSFWVTLWHPTPVLLPGKSHGRRSLVGCSPWDCWGLDTTEQLHFHFSLSCIGEGNGNPLQCSCLENPRDGGAWWAALYGVAQSWTGLKWLSSSSSRLQFHPPH